MKENSLKSNTVLVSPDTAREWLKANQNNRPISIKHVQRLAKSMINGDWKMTGDPIRFSTTGKLIDGQHRLTAIIESGISIYCVVIRDLDENIFDVIDSGRSRQKSDVIAIEFPSLHTEVAKILGTAATISHLYYEKQYSFRVAVEKTTLLDFINSCPYIIECAEYGQALPRQSPCARSIAASFLFLIGSKNSEKGRLFLNRFMVGENLSSNDMLLFLRNFCYRGKLNRRPLSTRDVMWRLAKIWNAEKRGKPLTNSSSIHLRENEDFPIILR